MADSDKSDTNTSRSGFTKYCDHGTQWSEDDFENYVRTLSGTSESVKRPTLSRQQTSRSVTFEEPGAPKKNNGDDIEEAGTDSISMSVRPKGPDRQMTEKSIAFAPAKSGATSHVPSKDGKSSLWYYLTVPADKNEKCTLRCVYSEDLEGKLFLDELLEYTKARVRKESKLEYGTDEKFTQTRKDYLREFCSTSIEGYFKENGLDVEVVRMHRPQGSHKSKDARDTWAAFVQGCEATGQGLTDAELSVGSWKRRRKSSTGSM